MLLQIVTDAWDVRRDFKSIGETNTTNFTKSRIRLLRSRCVNAGANTPSLRAAFERRRLGLPGLLASSSANELINSGHSTAFPFKLS